MVIGLLVRVKLKKLDGQKKVESGLNGDCEIQAAQTVLKEPR